MPDRLLVSDANILIDIEVGRLTDAMFQLPYEFGTPNILYEQELALHHPELPQKGLQLLELEPTSIQRMSTLGQRYTGVSSYDLAALSLAQQVNAPLLTGDGKLRQVCLEESIDVHGTVWLVGETLIAKIITVEQARAAYQLMEDDGSRLPWDDVEKQLRRFGKK
ncbi:MAG: DUF3368 domain-containing protein [Gammaproteobacteria bacterium]|jgi:hypothetical protein